MYLLVKADRVHFWLHGLRRARVLSPKNSSSTKLVWTRTCLVTQLAKFQIFMPIDNHGGLGTVGLARLAHVAGGRRSEGLSSLTRSGRRPSLRAIGPLFDLDRRYLGVGIQSEPMQKIRLAL